MANYVYIATTVDGFIADKNGGLDWLRDLPNPHKSDYGFNEFMKRIDGIVMGRNTFEQVLSFGEWPYPKKVFVLSTTLKEIPHHLIGHVEIVNGNLSKILYHLREKGFANLYIDGGKTIQSFLNEDLIDEMIITRVPILLGDGIPLFAHLDKPIKFKEVQTEILNETLVKSHYKNPHRKQ